MLTDESVLEWANGWLLPNTPEDPTFRQRFLDGLAEELKGRREMLLAATTVIGSFRPPTDAKAEAPERVTLHAYGYEKTDHV